MLSTLTEIRIFCRTFLVARRRACCQAAVFIVIRLAAAAIVAAPLVAQAQAAVNVLGPQSISISPESAAVKLPLPSWKTLAANDQGLNDLFLAIRLVLLGV